MADARLVLIAGDESFLRQQFLDDLLREAGVATGDFDFEETLAGSSRPSDWIAAVSTVPFMADKRTLVVRHLLRAGRPDDLGAVKWIQQVPESGRLILVADDEVGEQSRFDSIATAWSNAVKKAKGQVLLANLKKDEAKVKIQKHLDSLGKSIPAPAVEALMEMVGGSYSLAVGEAEKLALFVGESKDISLADVRQVVTPSREWRVFAYVDALIFNRPGEAMSHLRSLVAKLPRADEAGPRHILPMIHRQVRLLWQARSLLDAGVQLSAAAESAPESLLPGNVNLASSADFVKNKTLQQAKKISQDQILAAMQELSDLDARLKGMLPAMDPFDSIEVSTLKLVDIFRGGIPVAS
ncbi:MAG: putative protein YqeN [Fimbriimonadaceae bacterium]|nr:putative protein YqeN [Fimbriimonadaceae bacterium]